jgi:dinuclear metal center YbgI/SA1388 family protein
VRSAQAYDNVGLQVGDSSANVDRIVVALDLTRAVIEEAIERGANLIVTHHPIIFKPIKKVTAAGDQSGLPFLLARAGISHIAIHTNLDAAHGGVSFALAEQLGLRDVRFILGMPDVLQKLVVFVPEGHAVEVRDAIAAAGAGRIGEYDACAFETRGTGYFRAGDDANPFIGAAGGDVESAEEIRLEVEAPNWAMPGIIRAMIAAHPYEEAAHDIYDLRTPSSRHGLGAVGILDSEMNLADFLTHVASCLGTPSLRYTGSDARSIKKVAVCGGSGSSFIGDARRTGADAYVTADVTYHRFFEVLDDHDRPRMALIDAGHYETEAITEKLIADHLRRHFSEVPVQRAGARTNPVRYWQEALR